jgi:hypothetical protein
MTIGSRLLSIVAGPVNIRNATWHAPPMADLVGIYRLSKLNRAGHKPLVGLISKQSGISLSADHRAELIDVPALDGFGEPLDCGYNGTGDWSW